jgi:Flp pilus assembly protein TadD
MLLTWTEIHYWHDSLSLWDHALEVTEGNFIAHTSRGNYLLDMGDLESAERDYREALRFWIYADPYRGMGMIRLQQGETEAAERFLQAAVALDPSDPDVCNLLGVCLMKRGKREEAARWFREALRLKPDWPPVRNNLRKALKGDANDTPE